MFVSEKNIIFDAIKRKKTQVTINRSVSNRYVKNILDDLYNNYWKEYPYLKNLTYEIKSSGFALSASTTIIFDYGDNGAYNNMDDDMQQSNSGVCVINDNNYTSFLPYIKLSNGYIFEIITNNPNRVIEIIKKEMTKIIEKEEGVNKTEVKGCSEGMKYKIIVSFILGMSITQFKDRRNKGYKKAEVIYNQITHKGDLPVVIVSFLAYAYLQRNVVYDKEYAQQINMRVDSDKHMTYGALVRKSAVCEGYAWAFINIMKVMNVEAKLVTGVRGGPHAWTIIKINNKWYNVDPTLNPNANYIVINNFLVSDETLKRKGYQFGDKEEKCFDTSFENFEVVKNDIEKNRDLYIRKGANAEFLKSEFYVVK